MRFPGIAIALLLVLAGLVAADEDEVQPEVVPPEVALPTVGVAGAEPPETGTIDLTVTKDGTIRLADVEEPLSFAGLREELALRTRDPAPREPYGASALFLLVRADRDLPWTVITWLMGLAEEPRIGLYQFFLAARSEAGGDDGAVALYLSKDRGIHGPPRFREEHPRRKITLAAGDLGRDPFALFAALKAIPAEARTATEIVIGAPTDVAWVRLETVLQVVDVCLRAGVRRIRFDDAPAPPQAVLDGASALGEWIQKRRQLPAAARIRLDGKVIEPAGEGSPPLPPPDRTERHWGIRRSSAAFVEPEPIPEEPAGEDVGSPPRAEPGVFPHRRRGSRPKRGRRAEELDRAVDEALRWLVAHQRPDGSWAAGRSMYDTGVTAIACLALLGAGHASSAAEPFGKAVYRGLRYLRGAQDHEGCFGKRNSERYVYNHAWATEAMVEAYAMRRSRIWRVSAQKALAFAARARNPYFAWRYGIRSGESDTSVTTAMVSAIHAARRVNAYEREQGRQAAFVVDEEAYDGARAWLERATDPDTGRVGYRDRGGLPFRPQGPADRFPAALSEAPTAMGVWMHALMGVQARARVVTRARELFRARPPVWDPDSGGIDLIYWYYATFALHHFGGQSGWRRWERALLPVLLDNQRKDTTKDVYRGSWDPAGAWGPEGGRVYATALSCLCLEVHYRYTR